MVFQNPMSSLNPVWPIGDQVAEGLRVHKGFSRAQSRAAAIAVLKRVGIPSAGNPGGRLSLSMVGRHDAARGDRHGDGGRAETAAGR